MNYLKQIKGFHLRRRLYPLSSTAIALYYLMLEQFNIVGFPETMEIPMMRMMSEANIGKTTFYRARRELVEKGYLRLADSPYESHSTMYRLIVINPDFYSRCETEPPVSYPPLREGRMLHFGGDA